MKNVVFYKTSTNMKEIKNNSIDLVITSPPYFNIKDYSKNGRQDYSHSKQKNEDIGNLNDYRLYIENLLKV